MVKLRLNELAKEIHREALDKGWWDNDRGFPEVIALCHSELSEALEAYRDGDILGDVIYYDAKGKPEGIPTELADVIIRILDASEAYGIDIERALDVKMEYNRTRPRRHGGKLA